MAYSILNNVKIVGMSCAVPSKIIKSEEYIDIIGKESVDKFIKTVGIKQRHICNGSTTASDLCCAAAENLFEEKKIQRLDIEALILVTQTPDYIAPSTACIIQDRLSLSKECLAFDVNLCCSGYVYGLHLAMLHIQSRNFKKVLLLVGDTASYTCSPEDRGQMMLFGDSGTATLLEYFEGAENSLFHLKTIGEGFRNLLIPKGGYRHWHGNHERVLRKDGTIRSDYDCYMNGAEVFKFSITEVPKLIGEFFSYFDKSQFDYDYIVFHQANKFIINNIAKRLKMNSDKLQFSIEEFGNVGSGTIPLTLCYNNYNQEKENTFLLCGFGIGLSLGVVELKIDREVCLPIIMTDVIYNDRIEDCL